MKNVYGLSKLIILLKKCKPNLIERLGKVNDLGILI